MENNKSATNRDKKNLKSLLKHIDDTPEIVMYSDEGFDIYTDLSERIALLLEEFEQKINQM